MAALFREKTANYVVNEHVEVDTEDHEDHTFSGVMFTVEANSELPVDFIQIDALSVRGALGPLTVWATEGSWEGKYRNESAWVKVYERVHESSWRTFVELKLDEKVIIPRGESVGVYIHSKRQGDEAIVYDNQRTRYTHTDQFIKVGPGLAHLSNMPFSNSHSWGAWRERRQFVGRVSYGAKFELWNPQAGVHSKFPAAFKELARFFLFIKPQDNCPLSWMSNDILFYILNMCRWDWVPPSAKLKGELEKQALDAKELKAKAKRKSKQEQKLNHLRFMEQRGSSSGGGGAGGGSGGGGLSAGMAAELRALEQAQEAGTLGEPLFVDGVQISDGGVLNGEGDDDDDDDDESGFQGGGGRGQRYGHRFGGRRMVVQDDDDDEDDAPNDFQSMMRWVIMSSSPAAAAARLRLSHQQNGEGAAAVEEIEDDDDEDGEEEWQEEDEQEEDEDDDNDTDEDEEGDGETAYSACSPIGMPIPEDSDEDEDDDDGDNGSDVREASAMEVAGCSAPAGRRMAWMLPSAAGRMDIDGVGDAPVAAAAEEEEEEHGDEGVPEVSTPTCSSASSEHPSIAPLTAQSFLSASAPTATPPPEPPAKAYRRLYRGSDADLR